MGKVGHIHRLAVDCLEPARQGAIFETHLGPAGLWGFAGRERDCGKPGNGHFEESTKVVIHCNRWAWVVVERTSQTG